MRTFALLLSTLIGVRAIACPDYYDDGGDGSCYNTLSYDTRVYGYNDCANYGAYIADVQNAFQNNGLQQKSWGDFVWIGLTCLDNSITSCQWDTGTQMTSSSYNNFDGGRPIVEDGPCVIMSRQTGKWYSADCSNARGNVVCKYTPNVKVTNCDYGSGAFRGKCYAARYANSATNAASICSRYDSTQTSIHSNGENSYVKGLAVFYGYTQLFVGIQSNGTWVDGTAVDYENYGYKNDALGSCTSMSLYGDLVPAGMWISSQCTASQGAVTVCKKDPIEPTPVPTMAPLQCSGTQFLSGYGTVYSPGYPLGSQPNHCEYLITEDDGYQAQITFPYVKLDQNSVIKLYSGLFDSTPFQNLTNTDIYWQTYQSPTNVLKIVYDTAGSENNKNSWYANYQPLAAAIQTTEEPETSTFYPCENWYFTGTVESPNFPNPYPQDTNTCNYYLYTNQPSTCFKFDVFNIRYYDYVYLYDGYPHENILLASFTGYDTADGIYCTYHNSFMTLVFSTFSYNQGQVEGWAGRIAADSSELTGTTPYY